MDPKRSLLMMRIMRKKIYQKKVKKGRLKLKLHFLRFRHYQSIVIRKIKQIVFLQLLNTSENSKRRYWMVVCNQLWFETMWDNREFTTVK